MGEQLGMEPSPHSDSEKTPPLVRIQVGVGWGGERKKQIVQPALYWVEGNYFRYWQKLRNLYHIGSI
jgi:hypothetical protein